MDFKILEKRPDENREQYILRIYNQVYKSGEMNWIELTPIMNSQLFHLQGRNFGESVYRKLASVADLLWENVFSHMASVECTDEIRRQTWELAKERIKLRDERTELNAILRKNARKESLTELIRQIFKDVPPSEVPESLYKEVLIDEEEHNDLVVHFTDIHGGIEIDNWFNVYNRDVLAQRANKFLKKIIQIQARHHSENCYIIVGEIISGLIHEDLRSQNSEDVIEQFRKSSYLISDFVSSLSKYFKNVWVYTTPGNHSRIAEDKKRSHKGENLDLLLPDFLEARLQKFTNVHIMSNDIDPYVATFSIRGNVAVAAHGDKDTPKNVVKDFTMLLGVKPKLVFLGHLHQNGMVPSSNSKVIQTGCVSGSDNFAIDHRFHTDPEQTVSVVTENGLECLYNVNLK